MDVSVVIPTRNRRALLSQTLQSVRVQRDVEAEIIVVDDGSTDGTAEAVTCLRDPRIRLLRHHKAVGVSLARNRGIAEARGQWVGFCDDDDLWAPDKLLRQLVAARAAGAEWVYGGAVSIDLHGRVRGGEPPLPPEKLMTLLSRWDPIPGGCSNVIVSLAALRETGPFAPEFGTLADWELWLRFAARGLPAWVPRPLVAYRVHPSNMSLDVYRTLAELDLLEERYGITVDRVRFGRYLASMCLRSGRKADALRLILRAALIDRSGYGTAEAREDVGRLWRFVLAGAARRLRIRSSKWRRLRHEQQRRKDPHLAWKAEAQTWLDAIPEPAEPSTRSSTHP